MPFFPSRTWIICIPDWGIALAASANGKEKMEEFNQQFGHKLVWIPWQRPGFELAMMLERAVKEAPGCDGVVLGGHGLFTWGDTQRESYLNTITIIDQIGQFIESHRARRKPAFFWRRKVQPSPGAAGDCCTADALSARQRLHPAAHDRQLHRYS